MAQNHVKPGAIGVTGFGQPFLSLGYLVGVAGTLLAAWSVINGSLAGFLAAAALIGGVRASAEQGR